jgi:hypothetical protein
MSAFLMVNTDVIFWLTNSIERIAGCKCQEWHQYFPARVASARPDNWPRAIVKYRKVPLGSPIHYSKMNSKECVISPK